MLNFFIVKTNQCPILSFKASQELNLITVVMNVKTQELDDLVSEYSGVFDGLGCLDQPYYIKIDNTVQPIVYPPQNIPVALRECVREEIDRMEKLGVLKKVEEPTVWVNTLVVVEKPKTGKLRLCLDCRHLNKTIQREHFQLPTIEDISTRLTGAKVFSSLIVLVWVMLDRLGVQKAQKSFNTIFVLRWGHLVDCLYFFGVWRYSFCPDYMAQIYYFG